MTSGTRPPARTLVGRALVSSALVLAGLAAAFWFGWLPVAAAVRPVVTGVLLLVAVCDGALGLRFMSETS